MEKAAKKKESKLIVILSIISITIFLTVVSFLSYTFITTYIHNQELKEMKEKVEQDYADLLTQSEKFNDETYYTIYFNDQYMVIEKDQIIIEFK